MRRSAIRHCGVIVGLILVTAVRADEATDLFEAASGFFNREYYDHAAPEYEKFLEKYPNHELAAQARFFLAESHFQLKKFEPARQAFAEYTSKYATGPHLAQARYRAGEISYLLGDWKLAESWLTQFTAKHASDRLMEYALPYLAESLLNGGKPAEARPQYERAIQLFPNGRLADRTRFGLAQTLERLRDVEGATRMYREIAAGTSEFGDDSLLALGASFFAAKSFELSIEAYDALDKRFAASPLRSTAMLNRGLCQYQLQRWDAAEASFRAIQDPKLAADAAFWLGMTLSGRRQFPEAAKTLFASFERFRENSLAPEMLFQSADALLKAGHHDVAEARFLQVAEQFPGELADDAVYNAVHCCFAQAKYDRVLTLSTQFAKSYAKSDFTGHVGLLRAQALLALDRPAEALTQLRSTLASRPDVSIELSVRFYVATALHKSGKRDDAIAELIPVLASNRTDPAVGDAHYLAGTCHFEKQDYAKSVALLARYLQLQPQGELAAPAWSYITISLASLGRYDELQQAVGVLRGKYAAHASALPALLRAGEACYAAKRYDLARQLYEAVAEADPKLGLRARALSALGWSHYHEKHYGPSAEIFARLLSEFPTDALAPEAGFVRGRALEADNKLPEAITAYAAFAEKYPTSPFAFDAALQRARSLQKANRSTDAIDAYRALAEGFAQHPKRDVVLHEWAWAHLLAKQDVEAAKLFDRVTREFPSSPLAADAVLNAAELHFQQRNYDAVLAQLKAIDKASLPARIQEPMLFRRGRTHVELAAWTDAKASFTSLTSKFPESPLRRESEYWIAECDYRLAQPQAVASRLAPLIQTAKLDTETWLPMARLRLAQAQGELKQWKESVATCEELIKRHPQFGLLNEAQYHRGRALQSLGRFDEARACYRLAIAVRGDETAARSQLMIGESFFHQRRYTEAVREFLKVEILYDFPEWQARGMLEAAKCHEFLEEWGRAVETYNRILTRFAKSQSATEAAQRIQIAAKKGPRTPR